MSLFREYYQESDFLVHSLLNIQNMEWEVLKTRSSQDPIFNELTAGQCIPDRESALLYFFGLPENPREIRGAPRGKKWLS